MELTPSVQFALDDSPHRQRAARRFLEQATIAAVVALVALAVSYAVVERATRNSERALADRAAAARVVREAELAAVDRETTLRGFLLAGDQRALAPNFSETGTLARALDSLIILADGYPRDRQRIARLREDLSGNPDFIHIRAELARFVRETDAEYAARVMQSRRTRMFFEIALATELAGVAVLLVVLLRRLDREMTHLHERNELLAHQSNRMTQQSSELRERTRLLEEQSEKLEEFVEDVRASERRERQASELLRTVLDSSPLAIFAFDLELDILVWNPAAERLFGWPAAEVIGRPHPLAVDRDRNDILHIRDEVVATGRVLGLRRRRTRSDGSEVETVLSFSLLRDARGDPAGVIVVAEDLTARLQLEAQLRQSQKMEAIGRLAGGVAHDFNNILTVVVNYASLLRRDMPADERLEYTAEITGAAKRAGALTRQLLAFSRQSVLLPRAIDLNRTVTDIESMLRRGLGEDVVLVTNLAASPATVHADPGQIGQVLLNLTINARDAMPNGGRITIATSNVDVSEHQVRTADGFLRAGRHVCVSVADVGTGIPDELLDQIFEPFFTTKPIGVGTGLGLSTVHGIVEQSGGAIRVESRLGEGTTFTVLLPETTADVEAAVPADVRAPRGENETILVVEDDAAVRRITRHALVSGGYEVVEAENGDDALEKLHVCEPALVLADVVMPGMRAKEFATRLRRQYPDLPIVFMSGYPRAAEDASQPWMREEVFVEKPFTSAGLLATVRGVLDAAAARAAINGAARTPSSRG